ncbi:hypothetical protein D9619_004803 [Psilocybe cf. subviscida]|uniref:Uncharacterized protein n=1 Tax=Psilocybe cf. subviscida TaxID=2480587 RepID=A0A8H5BQQ7_9AGAR|nr:hypothetical protein D9619_004803 [Psilocybe cf. subviscida]
MKSFFAPLAVIAAFSTTALSQFTINTPLNVVVCQPALLTWVGGTGPFFLVRILRDMLACDPADPRIFFRTLEPSAAALVDLGQQSGNSVTWLANLGVGIGAFLNLRDNTGAIAQSGTFTVQTGSNTTCVGQPASLSAGPGATPAPAPSPAPGPSPAPSAGSPSPSAGSPSGGAASTTPKNTATGSGSGAAPKPTSGALSKFAGAGAAAFVGSALLSIVV